MNHGILDQPDPVQGTRRRRRDVAYVAVAVTVVGAGLVTSRLAGRSDHPDPDPGGFRARLVQQTSRMVPRGARLIGSPKVTNPVWTSCDGRPGTAGWTVYDALYAFKTTDPRQHVLDGAFNVLRAQGWTATRTVTPSGQAAVVAQWPAGTGIRANTELSAPGARDGNVWNVRSSAVAAGPLATGC